MAARVRYRPTAPYQHNPKIAPTTMATGGGTLNHALPEYVTAATTTHHGSLPRLCPLFLSEVRYPISHNRYTAVKTSPTAVAFTPLRKSTTYFFFRNTRQKLWIATANVIPGRKIPKPPRKAPKTVGNCERCSASAPKKTAKLKLGPGKAWMIASPIRKSLLETQPGSTT